MIRISYSSQLLPIYNIYNTIQNINLVSMQNNTKNNINGELFWNHETGNIIQILEGKTMEVNRLFEKIKKDHRHIHCKLMEYNEITELIYTKWVCNIAKPKKTSITLNDFNPISFLGKGGFANVILMENALTKKKYAVKVISKININHKKIDMISREKNILNNLNNKFIVKLHYNFQDPLHFYLMLDYVNGGDLYNLIHNNKNLLQNISVLKYYFHQLIIGVDYLHGNNIIHGDLKLENILLEKNGQAKIADFGSAIEINKTEDKKKPTTGHTLIYMAPEQIYGKIKNQSNDIWALALIIYEIYYLNLPWKNYNSINDLMINILNLDIELKTSDEKLNDLYGSMTIKNDYKDRFTSKQILKSEYCSDINWENVYKNKNIPDILKNDHIFYSPEQTNYIRGLSTDLEAEFSI